MTIRDDIPLGYTYNAAGQVLTYRRNDGYWYEYTYNAVGQVLTYRTSNDYGYEYTYNDKGQELTYRDSRDYWYEHTYDAEGNELTFKDPTGNWKFLVRSEYDLYVNEETGIYRAGCQKLNYEEALAYLRGRTDYQARKFRKAIKAHHNHLEQA